MKTKEFIYESMINYLKKCYSGAYGQLNTIDVYSVFKDRTDEVINYLHKTDMIRTSSFSGRGGSYRGIGGLYDIQDAKLRLLCEEAWMSNSDRKRSLNSW
jgi:hypothetical protein